MNKMWVLFSTMAVAASLFQPGIAYGIARALMPSLACTPMHKALGQRRTAEEQGLPFLSCKAAAEDPAKRKNPGLYSETTVGAAFGAAKTTGALFKSNTQVIACAETSCDA